MWAVTAGILLVALLVYIWKQRARPVPGLPVAQPFHFFFGNMLTAIQDRNHMHDRAVERFEKYGPKCFTTAFPFRNGAGALWLEPDEKLSEYVHKTNWKNYQKGPMLQTLLEELIGDGIFAVNGEKWRHQRKTASHIFSERNLKEDMAPVFSKHGHTVVKILEELSKKDDEGNKIDIQDLFFRYTITAFCEIGFGEDIQALTKDPKEVPFARAFDVAQYYMCFRLTNPFWQLNRWMNRFLPIFPYERNIADSIGVVDKFAYDVIRKRKEEKDGTNLVARFLASAKVDGEAMSDKFLRDVVLNFLIAGRDTTACALSWLIYLLSLHPEVEEKVHQEVMKVVGDSTEPTYEHAKQMVYLDAAIHETLRLYPSVPFEFKTAVEDDVLPNGVKVPAKTMMVYAPYLWGRAETLWPDAKSFKPERWLGEEKHSQFKFVTFNAGPRLCLGKHVALFEAKLLAAMLVRRFKFKLVEGQSVTYQPTITLPVKNGLSVHVQKRK